MGWQAFNSAGSPILTTTYDRLGRLVLPAVAVTGATTATIGRMHYVTGTAADYTITLPAASGNTGAHLAFVFGPTTTELSILVTLDGNASETINGSLTRVFWAGEALELECDGSNWWVVDYKFMPMACTMTKSTQNINTGTQAQITLDTTVYDNTGLMANTGANKMTARRTGRYTVFSQSHWNPTLLSALMQTWPKINNVSQRIAERNVPATQFVSCDITQPMLSVTAAQDIILFVGNFSAGTEAALTNMLTVKEEPGW